MATVPAGGSAYGDLAGTRQFINVNAVLGTRAAGLESGNLTSVTALTQAVANAASSDYTVEDLLGLINTAIAGERTTASDGFGLATSDEN